MNVPQPDPLQLSVSTDGPLFVTVDKSNLFNLCACTSITFTSKDGTESRLDWSDGTMRFTGNADEAAQKFFEAFADLWKLRTDPSQQQL